MILNFIIIIIKNLHKIHSIAFPQAELARVGGRRAPSWFCAPTTDVPNAIEEFRRKFVKTPNNSQKIRKNFENSLTYKIEIK
jgi:hypothetical protein